MSEDRNRFNLTTEQTDDITLTAVTVLVVTTLATPLAQFILGWPINEFGTYVRVFITILGLWYVCHAQEARFEKMRVPMLIVMCAGAVIYAELSVRLFALVLIT